MGSRNEKPERNTDYGHARTSPGVQRKMGETSILQGRQAAEASINELINYLNQFIYVLGDINDDQMIDILDIIMVVNFIMGLIDFEPIQFLSADINENGIINILDIIQLVNIILE